MWPATKTLNVSPFEAKYGYNYDFVMVFHVHAEKDELTPKQLEYSMRTILHRLASGGLETCLFYSANRDRVFCKIRASLERLCKEADRINYKCELDSREVRIVAERGIPQHSIKPIVIEDIKGVSRRNPFQYIFTKYDTQGRLQRLYKKYGIRKIPFRGVDRLKLISSILKTRVALGGCGLQMHELLLRKCVVAFYPLHTPEEKCNLRQKWIVSAAMPMNQPLEEIKDYYGEKIGLYFAWIGHYTTWLAAPSLVGCLVMIDVVRTGSVDSSAVPYFGLFVALWSTFYLEYWKRYNAVLAMEWGMSGFEDEEQDRPQFQGEEIPSPVDGASILWFSPMQKLRRVVLSLLFVGFLLLLVISVVTGIFVFRYFSRDGHILAKYFTFYGKNYSEMFASLVNAVQIQVMNGIYETVAIKLNDYENHRTETEYEDHLIAKTFLFQFVNSYASCFYIAFIKNSIPNEACAPIDGIPNCMGELSVSLGIIFVTRLTSGNFMEVVLPYLKRKWASKDSRKRGQVSHRVASQAETEFKLSTYDSMGTFNDYSEITIQFGYATLFVVAFPLAPLLAMMNNYAEIRVDAHKLSVGCRRPEPRGAEDIGTWYSILEIMATVAVVTNAGLIVFTSVNTVEAFTMEGRMWLFIIIEHVVLLTKFFFSLLVDDVPGEVRLQQERARYLIEKIILLIPDDDDAENVKGNKLKADLTIFDEDNNNE